MLLKYVFRNVTEEVCNVEIQDLCVTANDLQCRLVTEEECEEVEIEEDAQSQGAM